MSTDLKSLEEVMDEVSDGQDALGDVAGKDGVIVW